MVHRKTYSSSLAQLLKGICKVPSGLDTHVSGLSIDSRKVQKGDLFLALSGSQSKSTDHINEAIAKGANAIIAEGVLNQGKAFEDGIVVELFVDDLKNHVGLIADRFFRSPSQEMSVVGVTGTNGKTSVSNYLANYFSLNGAASAVIGTLGYGIVEGGESQLCETGYTTPNVVDVHRFLAELRDAGAKSVFMEVSSHGLDQGRLDGVNFEGAVFTNLTREHLDYHGTMENYALSKSKLFKWNSLKFAVINDDDSYAHYFKNVLSNLTQLVTYSLRNEADICLDSQGVNHNKARLSAQVSIPNQKISLESDLVGEFNLSNLLAVVAVAVCKEDLAAIEKRISDIRPVNGRMEFVKSENNALVIIDYAHTPDALKNVLTAARAYAKNNLIVVFGCGGDRDKGKRPEMAALAEQLADKVVVTDDNPRTESPQSIVKDIFVGFSNPKNVTLEHQREQAIKLALTHASQNDVVVIAGKGHENYQEIQGQRFHFSDIEVVNQLLGKVSTKTLKNEVLQS